MIDLMLGGLLGMLMLGVILYVVAALNVGRTAHTEGVRLAAGARALQALMNKHGASIVTSGTAPGFANPYSPTDVELKASGFLQQYTNVNMPLGGTMQFTVRRSATNDLVGLACASNSVTRRGGAAPDIAAKVMSASGGSGLMTSALAPAVLNGPGMSNVASPISGPAVVCAWAYLPNPV